ncbi:hypothetical protein [Erwinia amylovora]|uniref:hypothetical protein n=2 Tax=Erwinia amylovora TaxID=552 RepID=UPI001CC1287B|nr:hypothetical protein [Erwinia amylovora]
MAALNKIVADNAPKVIKGHAGQRIRDARKAMREAQAELELISKTKKMHREFLGKAGEIITDTGGKISERLGEGYHQVAKEIADNIKNFQGKKSEVSTKPQHY